MIDTGHATLLKQIKVSYVDSKEFNQSSITRNFQRNETYHILTSNGQVEKISGGKEGIRSLLKDKDPEVTAFIEKNRLKCRGLEDYRKVITYYNTLFK
ncbi:hypothetical protein [Paraflavitalea speifideaquila]|uniref:hypothetical protein n=1 Tax=Paraflavitalea speifideaquila TaxID=3076558 RepID=UPI0028E7BC9D|nr:hypothetical protein [Paraflavitalea speifideiaquila]